MKGMLALCAIALGVFGPIPAAAQDREVENSTIIVEGERVESAQVRQQARSITHPTATHDEPLARFQRPVCVGTSGLVEDVARAVIDRIYANALNAGLEIDERDGCRANVWVIIVDDPDTIFDRLVAEDSFLVRHLSREDAQRVREQQGPVRAWNITSVRSHGGDVVSIGDEDDLSIPVNSTTNMSRLVSAVRLDIEKSVVLIAQAALAGLDTHTLGDYVTLRALVRTNEPVGQTDVATILTLFSQQGPVRLTAFDIAYLENTYSTSATRPARQVQGRVSRLMERAQEAQ